MKNIEDIETPTVYTVEVVIKSRVVVCAMSREDAINVVSNYDSNELVEWFLYKRSKPKILLQEEYAV